MRATVAWYRIAIAAPAQRGPLALYIPHVDMSCQVFANGRLIGQVGGLPPQPYGVSESRMLLPIPGDIAASGRLLLAVRVWELENYATVIPGGLYPAPRIGDLAIVAQWSKLENRMVYWQYSASMIELFANLIGGMASLILFALRRKEREYLWFGIYLLNWTVYHINLLHSAFRPAPYLSAQILAFFLIGSGYFAFTEFIRCICGQKRGWLYAFAVLFSFLGPLFWVAGVIWPQSVWSNYGDWGVFGFMLCIVPMLNRARRAGNSDAAILMIPTTWTFVEFALLALAQFPAFNHAAWAHALQQFWQAGIQWPFPLYLTSVLGDLVNVVVLIVLIRRFARSRSDEERLESELEAARTVQKVLIPDEVPTIPGFQVQAVYKPASQVGGDFFQIIATKSGGALIVIGDVSGKGMPAAMTVSLLVGTFRTLAHYTQSPAEILRAMNVRMLARSDGGFTTCLVLRADSDGSMTAANAGHLAPYLGGREVAIESGLPLGVSAESRYAETRFRLGPGEQVTLLTDGVPEARSASGELFGFESTAAISMQSAEMIAETARKFGQQDDVTVVRLALDSPSVSAAPALALSGEPART